METAFLFKPTTSVCLIVTFFLLFFRSFTIDVLFKNASNKEPEKLHMPGSSGSCTLDHFYKITEHLLLSDVKAACKSKKDHGGGTFLPETWNTGKLCIGLKGDCPHDQSRPVAMHHKL